MMNTALQWKDVSYSVRTGFWLRKKRILNRVSLTLPQGAAVGLVGPNGAGKTTTIKIGAGLVGPDCGQVLAAGGRIADISVRRKTGLLTELQYFYPHVTVKEWLRFLVSLTGLSPANITDKFSFFIRELQLEQLLNRQMKTLSKGQAQRVGLVQAMVHGPDILLLDEPMSGLDPYWRSKILRLLRDFRDQGGSILFSSHIIADVEDLCERIVLMQEGRVQWEGDIRDVRRQIRGYRVICTSASAEDLGDWQEKAAIETLPDKGVLIYLDPEKKDEFLNFALSEGITVDAVIPQLLKLEEVLFGLRKNAD